MTHGNRDVGANRLIDQRLHIVLEIRVQQGLNGRPDTIDDGVQVARLIRGRLLQLVKGRFDRSALRVAQHDYCEESANPQPRQERANGLWLG